VLTEVCEEHNVSARLTESDDLLLNINFKKYSTNCFQSIIISMIIQSSIC